VPLIRSSFQVASEGERLARVAAAEDVDGPVLVCDLLPVGGGEVADVRGVRPAVSKDLRGAGVDVRHPGGLAAEHGLHGGVQAPVSGAE
jgi:hypothetical protein